MALVGSVTGVVKSVVELPIGIVQSIGRELVSQAEEDGPEAFVAGLSNNAQRISLPMILDSPQYQPSSYPTSLEAHIVQLMHGTALMIWLPQSSWTCKKTLATAALNKKHLSEPQEHPSNFSRSHLSTSSIKSLILTTVQDLGHIVETICAATVAFTLGMTQGFRNAPALYGDTTVRPATDVTG